MLILNRINNVYIDCVYIYIYSENAIFSDTKCCKFSDLLRQGKEICFEETEILREILGIAIIPGNKLCLSCKIHLYGVTKDHKNIQQISDCNILDTDSPDICREEKLAKFNTTLKFHDLTPAPKLPTTKLS